jgi:glutaredoxin 3
VKGKMTRMLFKRFTLMKALLLALVVLACLTRTALAGETLSTGEDVDAFIDNYIQDHDIMVFAKSTCKYCKNSKKVLDRMHKHTGMKGWKARFMYLDYMSTDGPKIHSALVAQTGHKTVPNVFISGKFIGGNTELTELYKSGELLERVKAFVDARKAAE